MTSRKIPESAVENLVSDLEGKANVANTVTTNTTQTIAGAKVFTTDLRRKSTLIDITTQSEKYTPNNGFRFIDKNDKDMGFLENAQLADGIIRTAIHARNKDGYQQSISVFVPPSGTKGAYATAPRTPANPGDTVIVTADYARKFLTPTGTIIIWSASNPPAGYLVCNGAAISRTTYKNLFHVIGTTWGAGDGNTTFNLPNFGDRYPVGVGSLGAVGTLLNQGLPNITGKIINTRQVERATGSFSLETGTGGRGTGDAATPAYNIDFNASRSSNVYGASNRVQPFSSIVNFCIRY